MVKEVLLQPTFDLGEALMTGPEFWLNLQCDWDVWHSKRKHHAIQPLPDLADLSAQAVMQL